MTPEQCRDFQIDAAKKPCYFTEHALGCECNGNQVRTVNALWEIAAQLAELQQHLQYAFRAYSPTVICHTVANMVDEITTQKRR